LSERFDQKLQLKGGDRGREGKENREYHIIETEGVVTGATSVVFVVFWQGFFHLMKVKIYIVGEKSKLKTTFSYYIITHSTSIHQNGGGGSPPIDTIWVSCTSFF
jgi:hypothetical protein